MFSALFDIVFVIFDFSLYKVLKTRYDICVIHLMFIGSIQGGKHA